MAKRNNLEEESQHLLHRAMDSFRYERERAAAKRGGSGGSVWGAVWMAERGDEGGGGACLMMAQLVAKEVASHGKQG